MFLSHSHKTTRQKKLSLENRGVGKQYNKRELSFSFFLLVFCCMIFCFGTKGKISQRALPHELFSRRTEEKKEGPKTHYYPSLKGFIKEVHTLQQARRGLV